jgi:hypothetical protein
MPSMRDLTSIGSAGKSNQRLVLLLVRSDADNRSDAREGIVEVPFTKRIRRRLIKDTNFGGVRDQKGLSP